MDGLLDVTDFVLGEALRMPLWAVRALPNAEVVEWLAFWAYRKAMQELDS